MIAGSSSTLAKPAPHSLIRGVLGETEADRVLGAVLARLADFLPAGVGAAGARLPDAGLVPALLLERLEEHRRPALRALGMPDFEPAAVEAEIVAQGGGPVPRAPSAATERMLAGLYFFHARPEGFSGGGLRLASMLPPERGGAVSDIVPRHDSLLLFPAWAPHAPLPVVATGGLGSASFAVRLWVHRQRAGAAELFAQVAGDYAGFAPAFARHGNVLLPDCIAPELRLRLVRHFERLVDRGRLRRGDAQSDRHIAHNEPLARQLHEALWPAVQSVVGAPIKPSYVYASLYHGGAVLERHVDRPQCEYTLSLLLDYRPEPDAGAAAPWPVQLFLQPGAPPLERLQPLGGGLLFRGRDIPHARPVLAAGHRCWVLLLHYVNADFDDLLD